MIRWVTAAAVDLLEEVLLWLAQRRGKCEMRGEGGESMRDGEMFLGPEDLQGQSLPCDCL